VDRFERDAIGPRHINDAIDLIFGECLNGLSGHGGYGVMGLWGYGVA
jgi:hypothetical protein